MPSSRGIDLTGESIFTWGAPPLKFGAGAVDEIGFDMAQHGARRVLILTDPKINELGIPARIAESLTKHGISSEIFDGCHVEPTADSMDKAVGYAREQGPWDGFVAVGGGSSIDTAKAVNLLTTDEGGLMDYINQPVGQGRAPRRQLKPLIAVPTTAGTGSESTAMCVLDVLSMRLKVGISHWRLPDSGHDEGLPPRGLPTARADGAAWAVGLADRAGGVPVQLPRRPGASSPGRGAAGAGRQRPQQPG